MARYTGPITKKSRRLGTDLVGNDKAFEHRPYPPGQHGRSGPGLGVPAQLRGSRRPVTPTACWRSSSAYYEEADRLPGRTGEALLQLLETRLDNVVYRAGFANTRRQARQMVSHGHLLVNGKRVTIPSFRVSPLDIIDVAPKSLELTPFIIARETWGEREVPGWLTVKPNRMRILVHQLPTREQITIDVNEQAIVEFYSK